MLDFLSQNVSQTSWALTAILLIVVTWRTVSRWLGITWRGPGPWGVPVLGFYPFLREDYHIHLLEMTKKYGDPYLLSMGGKLYVHLSSNKTFREAFVTKAEHFTSRCQDYSVFKCMFEDGILFTEDEAWRVWRKFLGKSLRELGFVSKDKPEGPVSESAKAILDVLSNSKGLPVDINALITTQCIQMVRQLVFGNRVSFETCQKLTKAYLQSYMVMNDRSVLLCGKVAKDLILPRTKGYKELLEGKHTMESLLHEILNDHKLHFDPENPQDLIDLYLCEKKNREAKGDPQAKYFSDNVLVSTLVVVYGDGSTANSATITDYLRVLASQPDVQDGVYKEIVREIGSDRLPTYEDRPKMIYTNAVIKELERNLKLVSVIPSLQSNRDTTLNGVAIPKGTITLFNFYAMHKDPEVYKEPERFDPMRFMPDKENKRPKTDMPVLFGIGKRACAGEPFVMTEVFVYLTAILQKFTLKLDTVEKPSIPTSATDIHEILDCRLLAIPRN